MTRARHGAGAWLSLTLLVLLLVASALGARSVELGRGRRVVARALYARVVREAGVSALRDAVYRIGSAAEEAQTGPAARLAATLLDPAAGAADVELAAPEVRDLFDPDLARGLTVGPLRARRLSAPGEHGGRGVLRLETDVRVTGGGLTCRRRVVGLLGFTIDPLGLAAGAGSPVLSLDRTPVAVLAEVPL